MNNRTKAGKAGRAASPWNRFPHCETPRALRKFAEGKDRKKAAEAITKLKREQQEKK